MFSVIQTTWNNSFPNICQTSPSPIAFPFPLIFATPLAASQRKSVLGQISANLMTRMSKGHLWKSIFFLCLPALPQGSSDHILCLGFAQRHSTYLRLICLRLSSYVYVYIRVRTCACACACEYVCVYVSLWWHLRDCVRVRISLSLYQRL